MKATRKWTDVRPGIVAELGGEAAVERAHRRTRAYIDAYRLAERRTGLGLTRAEVTERMKIE